MVNARNVLLWLHIVVALVVMGPLILSDLIVPGVIRSGDAGGLRMAERVTSKLGPATAVIVVLGIVMVARHDAYSFSQEWVVGALVLYVLMLVNGIGVLTRTAVRALARLEAGEPATAEARTMQIAGAVNVLLVLAILWLMVAKPGL